MSEYTQTIENFTTELQQLMDKHSVVMLPHCCDCCCQSLSLHVVEQVPVLKVHDSDSYYSTSRKTLQVSLIVVHDRQPNINLTSLHQVKLD